jgi:hypothetical protein
MPVPDGEFFHSPTWVAIVRNSCTHPREALTALLACIDRFTDDELCWVGVEVVEAIIDRGWPAIRPELEAALGESASLRKASSCAGPQSAEACELLERSLRPGEDVRSRSSLRDD